MWIMLERTATREKQIYVKEKETWDSKMQIKKSVTSKYI